MNRFASTVVLGVAVILAGSTVKADDKDKIPDIGEIMEKAHGKEGLRANITKSIQAKEWDEAAKTVKEWEKLADALGKNKPEKGSATSWKKHTGAYAKTLKSLHTAIDKKNAKGATAALKQIGSSCKTCHTAHKES